MLQLIREKFTGVIALLIIGVIGITLVISFGGMDQGGAIGTYAAKVNGDEVDIRNFQRAVQNQLANQQEALRGSITEELEEQIKRNVLEGLVQNKIVSQYVKDMGFRVGDSRVQTFIAQQPIFQVGGQFSRESYKAVLASQGLTREYFESEQRTQMEIRQFEDGIVSSSFFTPSEFRRYIELLAESREASLLTIDPAEIAETISLEEADIEAFYAANEVSFTLPESVSLEYIEIRLADMESEVTVDEQRVRDYYEANADLYIGEDQRKSRHILVAVAPESDAGEAEALAEDLYQRVVSGEDFAELAREFSDDTVSGAQGGDLGWAGRGDFVGPFEEALFALEIGETSPPVRTEFGFHVIQLEAIEAGSQRAYEDVRDELLGELSLQAAADRYYDLAEKIDDLALENPSSLAAVSEGTGLEIKRIETFTRNGGEPFGFNPALIDAAFSLAVLEDGENSPLIELDDGTAVVLRVDEYREASVQPLAEVRAAVEEAARFDKARSLALESGEAILARLEEGETLEAIATENNLEVQQTGVLNRTSSEFGPNLLEAIYRAPWSAEQATFRGVQLANGGYTVFRLDNVEPGRADTIPQEARDQRRQLLARQAGGNGILALIAELRDKADVAVAPNLFDQPETF